MDQIQVRVAMTAMGSNQMASGINQCANDLIAEQEGNKMVSQIVSKLQEVPQRAMGSRWPSCARTAMALIAVAWLGFLWSGCAATTGAAGAALGYGITGNARGAALGAGAGILAGSLYDIGALRPSYPSAYYSSPHYYDPYYGRWIRVPGHWDHYGRWVPPHWEWMPY